MIAVIAPESEHPIIREFFELFKTPWCFYGGDERFDVLLCSGDSIPATRARLLIVYGSEEHPIDRERGFEGSSSGAAAVLAGEHWQLPIYGKCRTFCRSESDILLDGQTRLPAVYEVSTGEHVAVRVGYDLFKEVRHLLSQGQPAENAGIATLDLHIAFLRDLIISHSVRLLEIPPIPDGYDFITCLTHDVDHVGLRNHKCDHTMIGFLYRATMGSLLGFFRGRIDIKKLVRNWTAALSLPLVHLGLAKDFWYTFEQYKELEKGLSSTFFFIPERGNPGRTRDGRAPAKRAAKYDVAELTEAVQELIASGYEIGVHGIDAWRDRESGRAEMQRIAGLTGKSEHGVRMHWLFFDENAPAMLENAGFNYDSTVGYNETVGYRAGTAQSFRPPGVKHMMELPMQVMDTALFYPCYLNLSEKEAGTLVDAFIENAVKHGGALTINWHDRSIAPERLWGEFYVTILTSLKRRKVWFATASQAVSWFKKRRNVHFTTANLETEGLRINAAHDPFDGLPGLRIRVHDASAREESSSVSSVNCRRASKWVDIPWNGEGDRMILADS